MSEDDGLKSMGQVIQIDEARIRDHLGEMVRGTVEETLNALLDAEADRLCGAGRYERAVALSISARTLTPYADHVAFWRRPTTEYCPVRHQASSLFK